MNSKTPIKETYTAKQAEQKKVMMKDGKVIPISRRRIERVEKAISLRYT
ncbi:MAG: hypothetical protein U5M51_00375 [Emticicia sp.]|nr:hypothetical protein [Emticicia sp.]